MLTLLPKGVPNDTCGAPWAVNIAENFQKIWNSPNDILRSLEETDK